MKITEIKIIKLEANEDKILADGTEYGSTIFLGANRTVDEFYEIPIEEYDRIMAEQELEMEVM